MGETKRTFADWIWSLVGVAGIIFILVAIYMLVAPRFSSDPAREALENPKGAAEELWKGARNKLAMGDLEGGLRDLKQAVALVEGRHPVYLNDLGEAFVMAGQPDQAPPNWLAAIGLRPFYAQPYLNLGKWRDSRGELGHALACYRAALALHPEPVPEDLVERVASLIGEFRERRETELTKIRKNLHANPADFQALTLLVAAELATLRVDEKADPATGLRVALQKIGESLGDLDELLQRQESGAADRPDSVVDRAGLGVVLLVKGEPARSLEVFSSALELSASDRVSNLGASLASVLCGKVEDQRIADVAKAFRVNVAAWLSYGATLLERGETMEARKVLLTALQLNPSLPETYRLLALTFSGEEEEKDRAAALRGYQRLGE